MTWVRTFALFCFLALRDGCLSIRRGGCPKVNPAYFDPEDFQGRWFEVEKVETTESDRRTCSFAEFEFNSDLDTLDWSLIMNSTSFTGSQYESIIIEPRPTSKQTKGEFMVGPKILSSPNFFLLHVDKRFALTYLCQPVGPFLKSEKVWIMSRSRYPDPLGLRKMELQLKSLKIDLKLMPVKHKNCPDINDKKSEEQDNIVQKAINYSSNSWNFTRLDGGN